MMTRSICAVLLSLLLIVPALAADETADLQVLRRHMANMESRLARLEKTVTRLRSENEALHTKVAALKSAPAAVVAAPTMLGVGENITPEEMTEIEALIANWDAELAKDNWSQLEIAGRRLPSRIVHDYEMYKYDAAVRKWKEQPVFAANPKDHIHQKFLQPNACRSYQSQFFCGLCKDANGRTGWVNAAGLSCLLNHPVPQADRWRFLIGYCKERDKAIEAKAHLWNAKQHNDITESQWNDLMSEAF